MCLVGAAMGLQLSVRHAADIVIVDLHGKATIGRANDFLDSQLRQLIEVGTSKLLSTVRVRTLRAVLSRSSWLLPLAPLVPPRQVDEPEY